MFPPFTPEVSPLQIPGERWAPLHPRIKIRALHRRGAHTNCVGTQVLWAAALLSWNPGSIASYSEPQFLYLKFGMSHNCLTR